MWDEIEPVEVKFVVGENMLRFLRAEEVRGLTINDRTLKPLK